MSMDSSASQCWSRRPNLGFLDAFKRLCSNVRMPRGRILSIDYGTKNIGLACSDELGMTVRPLASVRLVSRRDLVSRLRSTIQQNGIEELVIGIPLNMNGSSGDSARQVEQFVTVMQREFQLPVKRVDERLSTLEAMDIWKQLSPRQQRKYRTIDSFAAALILERYLEEH